MARPPLPPDPGPRRPERGVSLTNDVTSPEAVAIVRHDVGHGASAAYQRLRCDGDGDAARRTSSSFPGGPAVVRLKAGPPPSQVRSGTLWHNVDTGIIVQTDHGGAASRVDALVGWLLGAYMGKPGYRMAMTLFNRTYYGDLIRPHPGDH